MTKPSAVDLDSTPKQMVLAIVGNLPDGALMEEIDYAIFVLQKALLARQAIADGDVLSHEEVKERLKQWLLPEPPKACVIEALNHLPDDATYEDIQYEIEFLERLNSSEQNIREGRFITHEEFKERFKQWLSPENSAG
jgi:predicted transcriptional regulator